MRTLKEFNKHKNRICFCDQRFLLCKKEHSADLFHTEKDYKIAVLPLHCKSYLCPSCGKRKANEFFVRAKKALKNDTWYMLTLTTINNYENTSEMLQKITQYWNTFAVQFKRLHKHVKYIRVLEVGKAGMVHLHVLINMRVCPALIAILWKRVSGAKIINVSKEISHERAINYVLKYVRKINSNDETAKLYYTLQKRRFSFSYNCKFEKKEKSNYVLLKQEVLNSFEVFAQVRIQCEVNRKELMHFSFESLPPPLCRALCQFVSDIHFNFNQFS